MTPVMTRCEHGWPLVECSTCTPTPDEGLHPDHRQPIPPPTSRAPADDTDGLAQPISARIILVVVGLLAFDAAVVVGVVKAVEWLLGLLR
jgi:hypothetical protein